MNISEASDEAPRDEREASWTVEEPGEEEKTRRHPFHKRPDMSRPPTEQEAFLINEWLHIDPRWFYPSQLPLTEQEATWLIAYISRVHAMFHPQMVPFKFGEQPDRNYQVMLSYPSRNPAQPLMQVIVHSLEDYTTLLRWAAGGDDCFEKETGALPPEQQACEEQRVLTFRRMIYTHLGFFLDEPFQEEVVGQRLCRESREAAKKPDVEA